MICMYGKHDWRMFAREPNYILEHHYYSEGGISHTTRNEKEYKELWYCTKCRYVEERVV